MTATPTGRLGHTGGDDVLLFTRTFEAPATQVWAALTEPDRLARWFGTWTGDPADGHVTFTMNAEGDQASSSRYDIDACEPPRHLAVTSTSDHGTSRRSVDLTEAGGVTTLVWTEVIRDPAMLEYIGPGWDFYLDRLVAAETGGDVGAIDFDTDYLAAQRDHYLAIRQELENP